MWECGFSRLSTTATPAEKTRHSIHDFSISTLPTFSMEQRIRYCRLRAGLTGDQTADLIGVHRDYYHLIEQKCDRIGVNHLMRFCVATSSDPSYVIYGDDAPATFSLDGHTIGEKIRSLRMIHGLSMRQFGYKVIGEKRTSSIGEWEKGKYIPELRSLKRISYAFGINVVSLFPDF